MHYPLFKHTRLYSCSLTIYREFYHERVTLNRRDNESPRYLKVLHFLTIIMISIAFILAVLLSLDVFVWWASAAVESLQLRQREFLPLEWAFERHFAYILNARGGAIADSSSLSGDTTTLLTDAPADDVNSTTELRPLQPATVVDQKSVVRSDKSKDVFSLFQVGDGSETDPDGIPNRYMRMQLGRRKEAMDALQATLAWRKEHDIDRILLRPQPKFDLCKTVFPHYFVGRDKLNHVVLFQRPALIDVAKAKANALSNEELLMHYVFFNEYLWQISESEEPLGTMTSVLDLTGLNLGILKKKELLGFCKQFISTMDAHYPQRAFKTLIINAPKWFNALYKLFSPLLRESTKAKIEIHARGKQQDEALMNLMDNVTDVFPPSVWSSYSTKKNNKRKAASQEEHADEAEELGDDRSWTCQSEMDRQLRAYVSTLCLYFCWNSSYFQGLHVLLSPN